MDLATREFRAMTRSERASSTVVYYGWALHHGVDETDALWAIKRVASIGGVIKEEWAKGGTFHAKWSDRATYFGAVAPGGTSLAQPVSIFDSFGNAITGANPLDVTASFSGLRTAGLISEVELSDTDWTALPPTPLAGRNAMSIQNTSGVSIKINYDPTETRYFGVQIASGLERFYDIKETIQIFAKAQTGTPKIILEELS